MNAYCLEEDITRSTSSLVEKPRHKTSTRHEHPSDPVPTYYSSRLPSVLHDCNHLPFASTAEASPAVRLDGMEQWLAYLAWTNKSTPNLMSFLASLDFSNELWLLIASHQLLTSASVYNMFTLFLHL